MKITSKRQLAIRLSNGPVDVNEVSVRLQKTVDNWLKRKEIIISGNQLIIS